MQQPPPTGVVPGRCVGLRLGVIVYVPWQSAPRAPRRWQAEALPIVQRAVVSERRAVIHACTGAGKSVLLAEICAWAVAYGGRVVVSVPSRDLVRQLRVTLTERLGAGVVGCFYTSAKEPFARVVVACNDSLGPLAAERARVGMAIDLWIADEVHQTEAETLKLAADTLSPRRAVGFTATPYRSDEAQSLTIWDEIAYSYTIGQALQDGVLVPWDVRHWDGEGDAKDINGICTRLILAHADGPGIVSARSIVDAEEYADALTAAGVPAEAVHSKQPRAVRDELLERLRVGDLRALVHVALLAEGVDLPWLRWICLRRRVMARVRFVQEVGRVLRVAPSKERAVVLDPYDLFSVHGITHPATLGEAPTRPVPEPEPEDPFPLLDLPPPGQDIPPAVAVDAVGAWSRALLRLMQAMDLHKPAERFGAPDARWRRSKASEKQAAALSRMAVWARYMPEPHRESVKAVCAAPGALRAGVASDLMDVLSAIATASEAHRRQRRHWPWPSALDVPVLPDRVLRGLRAAS